MGERPLPLLPHPPLLCIVVVRVSSSPDSSALLFEGIAHPGETAVHRGMLGCSAGRRLQRDCTGGRAGWPPVCRCDHDHPSSGCRAFPQQVNEQGNLPVGLGGLLLLLLLLYGLLLYGEGCVGRRKGTPKGTISVIGYTTVQPRTASAMIAVSGATEPSTMARWRKSSFCCLMRGLRAARARVSRRCAS